MDGQYSEGWYEHSQQGLIKIFMKDGKWVYQCYTSDGSKALARPKDLDPWTWALSEATEDR